MLRLCDVHKSYRRGAHEIGALRGVSLEIDRSGFFAIMGRSGSGKTTLLHLAAGLDRPDRGEIEIDGQPLGRMNDRELTRFRRHRVGIVFQQFNLIPTLTAAENVAMPGWLDRRPRHWIRKRVEGLLEDLELTPRAEHRPDALSGGEQQRVAIARALFFEPALLLADEPTGSLDSASSDRLWETLKRIATRQKTTVLMVTHEPAAAVNCEQVYVLGDGALLGEFDAKGLDASGLASRYQQFGR